MKVEKSDTNSEEDIHMLRYRMPMVGGLLVGVKEGGGRRRWRSENVFDALNFSRELLERFAEGDVRDRILEDQRMKRFTV